jgi:proline iminopeptidase
MKNILFLFFLITSNSFAQTKDSIYYAKLKQPGVKFIPVYNGKYKVFTQKIGSGKMKLLILHGGPGGSHESFENFPNLLKDVEIYFYDQLGSYYSDQPNDTSIWDIERFADEVEEVRKGLGLEDFYILGHSWGGRLGEIYTGKYPKHVKGLVLSNCGIPLKDTVSSKRYTTQTRYLLREEPVRKVLFAEKVQQLTIDSLLSDKKLADTLYQTKLNIRMKQITDSVFAREFNTLTTSLPEYRRRSTAHGLPVVTKARGEGKMLQKMALTNWWYWQEKIKCPVLLIDGAQQKYCQASIAFKDEMLSQYKLSKPRVLVCPNGSHCSFDDDSETYFDGLKKFLLDVENKTFKTEL